MTQMSSATIEDVKAILKQSDAESTLAIVVPSHAQAEMLYHAVSDIVDIRLVEEDDSFISEGYVIIPYDLVKGFEYDTVISWEHHAYNNTNIQYIIASRAISKLYLLDSKK